MATATDITALKKVIKASKARVQDFHLDVDSATEFPEDDLVYIDMVDANRKTVSIVPARRAVLQAYGDPKFRQIVLNVQEPARQVERVAIYVAPYAQTKNTETILEEAKTFFEQGRNFGVHLPTGTKYKVVGELQLGQEVPGRVTGTVRATIPKSNTHFLIGHDEHAMFVCVLPKPVQSVTAAHDALRPKGVPKDALRQGEFFFVPASDVVSRALDKKILQNAGRLVYGGSGRFLDENESHAAQTVETYNKNIYVIGFIAEAGGRHVPLFLDEWHKVVNNLEIQPPEHMDDFGSWD